MLDLLRLNPIYFPQDNTFITRRSGDLSNRLEIISGTKMAFVVLTPNSIELTVLTGLGSENQIGDRKTVNASGDLKIITNGSWVRKTVVEPAVFTGHTTNEQIGARAAQVFFTAYSRLFSEADAEFNKLIKQKLANKIAGSQLPNLLNDFVSVVDADPWKFPDCATEIYFGRDGGNQYAQLISADDFIQVQISGKDDPVVVVRTSGSDEIGTAKYLNANNSYSELTGSWKRNAHNTSSFEPSFQLTGNTGIEARERVLELMSELRRSFE